MTYELTFSLSLGTSQTGIPDLRAQLIDDAGTNVGGSVSTGFVEVGTGFYQWNYTSIPDNHRGGVNFYRASAPSTIVSFAAINPEEAEYTNTALSGIATTLAALPASIWAVLTITLTTTGSIGKLIVDKLGLIVGPVEVASANTSDIVITRAATLDGLSIPVSSVPGTWTKCYFTVKDNLREDLDSQSIIQIVATNGGDSGDGLLYLNAAVGTLADGSAVVGGDEVTVTLEDNATALLSDCQNLDYDVKFLKSDGKSIVGKSGQADINLTATRTI